MTWVNFITEDAYIHIFFMKTQCLQTKWDAALFGKGKGWEAGGGKESVLIKSLIYAREKRAAWCALWKIDQNRSNL